MLESPIKREFEEFKRVSKFYFSRLIDYPLVEPYAIQLNTTFKCNLRCKMCSIAGGPDVLVYDGCVITDKKKMYDLELTTKEIEKMIDEMIKMNIKHLIILGGEPFLRDDVFDNIEYAEKKGIRTIVVTNGTLIDEKLAKKIVDSPLTHLQFSIDGATAKTHDFIRGQNVFERTVNGIKLVNKYRNKHLKQKLGLKRLGIAATCTVMEHNVHELIDLVHNAEGWGLDGINFQPLMTNNANPQNKDISNQNWIKKEKLKILDKQIDQIYDYKKNKGKIDIGNTFSQLKLIKKYYRNMDLTKESKCYAGFNRILPTQIGTVYMCGQDLGDLRKDSMEKIWFSEKAKKARKKVKNCRNQCLNFCSYLPGYESKMLSIRQIYNNFLEKIKDEKGKEKIIKKLITFFDEYKPILEKYYSESNDNEDKNEAKEVLDDIEKIKKEITGLK